MPLTINDGTTLITLPDSMEWVDEYDYDKVKQDIQPMFGGGIVISENVTTAGRPITLKSGDTVWVTKSVIDQLKTMRDLGDVTMTLTLPDARTFTVGFDFSDTMKAIPIWRKTTQTPTDVYTLEIKFLEL